VSQTTATRPEPFVSEGSSPPPSVRTDPGFHVGLIGDICLASGTGARECAAERRSRRMGFGLVSSDRRSTDRRFTYRRFSR